MPVFDGDVTPASRSPDKVRDYLFARIRRQYGLGRGWTVLSMIMYLSAFLSVVVHHTE
jgi:hypothetical protein